MWSLPHVQVALFLFGEQFMLSFEVPFFVLAFVKSSRACKWSWKTYIQNIMHYVSCIIQYAFYVLLCPGVRLWIAFCNLSLIILMRSNHGNILWFSGLKLCIMTGVPLDLLGEGSFYSHAGGHGRWDMKLMGKRNAVLNNKGEYWMQPFAVCSLCPFIFSSFIKALFKNKVTVISDWEAKVSSRVAGVSQKCLR